MSEDITGLRFGRLVVIKKTAKKSRSCYLWLCRCDCGNEKLATVGMLRKKTIQSCGCLQRESRLGNAAGRRVGHLVGIESTGRIVDGSAVWRWRCDCGREIELCLNSVCLGGRTSCGCAGKKIKSAQALAMQKKCGRVEGTQLCRLAASKISKANSSGRIGVSWHKRIKKWQARLMIKREMILLGYYDNVDDAIKAREQAEKKYYAPILRKYGWRKKTIALKQNKTS